MIIGWVNMMMTKPVKNQRKLDARPVMLMLILVLLLSACRRAPEPSPTTAPTSTVAATDTQQPTEEPSATQAAATLTATLGATPYPAATTSQPSPDIPADTAYPGPSTPFPSPTSPYPGPPTPFPSPTSPYPSPPTPFPSPTSPYPVPSPGLPLPASPTPYPPPGSRPGYPAPGVTPTGIPGTLISPSPPVAGLTGTPQPTPTQAVVRTRLRATDPRTFQIVSGQHQLVEFFAFWDPVSRSMAPVVHALEDRYQGSIRFVYLDIEDPANSLFRSLIGSRLPPLFYLLDEQGNVLEEWRGYVTVEDFERAFTAISP